MIGDAQHGTYWVSTVYLSEKNQEIVVIAGTRSKMAA
jgi:hypothetical protein